MVYLRLVNDHRPRATYSFLNLARSDSPACVGSAVTFSAELHSIWPSRWSRSQKWIKNTQ